MPARPRRVVLLGLDSVIPKPARRYVHEGRMSYSTLRRAQTFWEAAETQGKWMSARPSAT